MADAPTRFPDRDGRPRREERQAAAGAFYRQWLRKPLEVAALTPSSSRLAALVADAVGDAARVLELGAGTGAVTEALVGRGFERLVVLETNAVFAGVLRERFPAVEVLEGDARRAPALLAAATGIREPTFDAVVCGLGMLTRPREEQRQLLAMMSGLTTPGGRIVQYSYSPVFPAARGVLEQLGLEARRAAVALFNLPPASVFVVRRQH
jgi:phospholipid N-methyltransferase